MSWADNNSNSTLQVNSAGKQKTTKEINVVIKQHYNLSNEKELNFDRAKSSCGGLTANFSYEYEFFFWKIKIPTIEVQSIIVFEFFLSLVFIWCWFLLLSCFFLFSRALKSPSETSQKKTHFYSFVSTPFMIFIKVFTRGLLWWF